MAAMRLLEEGEEGEGLTKRSGGGSVRPGELYAMYSAADVLGRLPDGYAEVLKRAEGWTGVSRDDLSAVIERFERRVLRLWKRRGREANNNESWG